MSDVERRVAESLRSAAEDAPEATGLAQGARARLRRRRRTTWGAAAAALVVVAVPVGITVASGDERDGASVATDRTDRTGGTGGTDGGAEPGWRTESWRDATVEVPADWGHGSLSSWCAGPDGEQPEPVVQRPSTMAPAIACLNPARGYGVEFVDARSIMLTSNEEPPAEVTDVPGGGESDYPAGAWVGYQVVGGTMVQVVATDEETATAIFDSIELLEGPDANGCPQTFGEAEKASGPGDGVALCRYSEVGELDASEVLAEEDSTELLAQIEEAPGSTVDVDCPAGPRTVVLQDGSYVATVDDCSGGVDVSRRTFEVTVPLRELLQRP